MSSEERISELQQALARARDIAALEARFKDLQQRNREEGSASLNELRRLIRQ